MTTMLYSVPGVHRVFLVGQPGVRKTGGTARPAMAWGAAFKHWLHQNRSMSVIKRFIANSQGGSAGTKWRPQMDCDRRNP